ncbi:MAG TPA: ribosome silencing factor [Myxococcota bacterium]|nr:ribosome silencing factor [Myxococcota bacterium]
MPPRAQEAPIDPRELAELILQTALDKKAHDPVMLEVGDLVGYAEIFVIVSARNPRQVRAIAEDVRTTLKHDHHLLPVGIEGQEAGRWVLVDYDDVVLHVFLDATRSFYDLEGLWADAPRLPVPDEPAREPDDLFAAP